MSLLMPVAAGCGPPADSTLQNLYKVPLPSHLRVTRYASETLGMDPSFAWRITPIDDAYLKQLVQKNNLTKAPTTSLPPADIKQWPSWWNVQQLQGLTEAYTNDREGIRHIFVDRSKNHLFIEFIGT